MTNEIEIDDDLTPEEKAYEEEQRQLGEWAESDYGYADFDEIDKFEDQKGMEELKIQLKINPNWILLKVVDFDSKKLISIDQWCRDECVGAYERVGFASGCSTKVAIAFEQAIPDAVMFKLRWR